MFRKSLRLAVAVALLTTGIIACSGSREMIPRETLLDQNWGRSYEAAKYNQILNPDSVMSLEPVVGMDGVASDNSVKNYDKSFSEKKNAEVTNILKLQ